MSHVAYANLVANVQSSITISSKSPTFCNLQIVDAPVVSAVKAVYFTTNGTAPSAAADGSECISAGVGSSVELRIGGKDSWTIHLLSASACTVQARVT